MAANKLWSKCKSETLCDSETFRFLGIPIQKPLWMPQTTAQQCYIDLWNNWGEGKRYPSQCCWLRWLYAFGQACKEGFTKHLRQDKVIAAVSGGKKGTLLSGGGQAKINPEWMQEISWIIPFSGLRVNVELQFANRIQGINNKHCLWRSVEVEDKTTIGWSSLPA